VRVSAKSTSLKGVRSAEMDVIQKINIVLAVTLAGLSEIKMTETKKRRFWVKKYRQRFGHLPLIQELCEHFPEDFRNYLRMDSSSFDILIRKVEPKIRRYHYEEVY
jgi:hypothetical protein